MGAKPHRSTSLKNCASLTGAGRRYTVPASFTSLGLVSPISPQPTLWGVDGADLAIAATAIVIGARLLTLNVGHFPMFPELRPAY